VGRFGQVDWELRVGGGQQQGGELGRPEVLVGRWRRVGQRLWISSDAISNDALQQTQAARDRRTVELDHHAMQVKPLLLVYRGSQKPDSLNLVSVVRHDEESSRRVVIIGRLGAALASQSHEHHPMTPEDLNKFIFERIINEDPATHSLALLGSLPSPDDPQTRAQAIIRIEKTALDANNVSFYFSSNTGTPGLLQRIELAGHSDIVRKSCLYVQLNSYVELSSDSTRGSSGGSEKAERKMLRSLQFVQRQKYMYARYEYILWHPHTSDRPVPSTQRRKKSWCARRPSSTSRS
jgi:hypothetical protein